MPDGDVIKRGVGYAWRPAYEGLSAGDEADVCGLVAKSLTAALRKRRIPPFAEAASLVTETWNRRLSQAEGLDRVACTVGSIGGTRAAAILDVAVRRAILDGPTGSRPDQAVVEAYLNALVDVELMSKVRPAMLENANADAAEVEERVTRWLEEIQDPIRRIAQQVVADPTGEVLRAPPSRAVRKDTASMLDESI